MSNWESRLGQLGKSIDSSQPIEDAIHNYLKLVPLYHIDKLHNPDGMTTIPHPLFETYLSSDEMLQSLTYSGATKDKPKFTHIKTVAKKETYTEYDTKKEKDVKKSRVIPGEFEDKEVAKGSLITVGPKPRKFVYFLIQQVYKQLHDAYLFSQENENPSLEWDDFVDSCLPDSPAKLFIDIARITRADYLDGIYPAFASTLRKEFEPAFSQEVDGNAIKPLSLLKECINTIMTVMERLSQMIGSYIFDAKKTINEKIICSMIRQLCDEVCAHGIREAPYAGDLLDVAKCYVKDTTKSTKKVATKKTAKPKKEETIEDITKHVEGASGLSFE